MVSRNTLIMLLAMAVSAIAGADEQSTYLPGKVVYDLSRSDPQSLKHLLDRVSTLQNVYGNNPFEASIIIVIHEGAIPLFAKRNHDANRESMQRAASLALGEIIEFRLCRMSAQMQGFGADDFNAFVTMVPMADAEIVRLQQTGYAYLN